MRWERETPRKSRDTIVVDQESRLEEKAHEVEVGVFKDEAVTMPIPIILSRSLHQTPIAMLMPLHVRCSLFMSFIHAFAGTSVHIKGFFSHSV